jgi:hypothetical protein
LTTGPPTAEDVLDAFGHAFDLLIRFSRRPAIGTILLNGKAPTGMTLQMPDNDTVDAAITFSDKFGDATPEPGPVSWAVSDPAVARITPNATDDTKAVVTALAGTGTFKVTATSGTLSGSSDDIQITPGAAALAQIAVTLEPPAAA